jgi:hypothetical protein
MKTMDAPMTHHDHDEHEDFVDHGWGDFRSWSYIIALCAFLILLSLVCYHFVGQGMRTEWNLGYPPTSPNFLAPLFGM